jgi:hypothetical protein|tara:strand:- start:526 stop:963 length:438 start_codon:yes stop_codon:yes gene_type:complete
MPARHDITSNQGETLNLHLLYTDSVDASIDLANYSAEFQVRRSTSDSDKLLHLYGSTGGLNYGATAGSTGAGDTSVGISGGIWLNRNAGNTGDETGGIRIFAGATATSLVPAGKHLYDLELRYIPDGTVTRLMEGRFDSPSEVTR